jgi:hypothetical protein
MNRKGFFFQRILGKINFNNKSKEDQREIEVKRILCGVHCIVTDNRARILRELNTFRVTTTTYTERYFN